MSPARTETPSSARARDMVRIPGGTFTMGSTEFYPDEAPAHARHVAAFALDRAPVTNDEFARFVADTGHVTLAERPLDGPEFTHLPDADRRPGSLVFHPTAGPVDLADWTQWWRWVPGADWRHPAGPGSGIADRGRHPVVHVAYADASAYAAWAGVRLPTEAEFELAARGGRGASPYAWGWQRDPGGVVMANTWRGRFPHLNEGARGWMGTSPVGEFPPNGHGLQDMIGNVWEWTTDYYTRSHAMAAALPEPAASPRATGGQCCAPAREDLARASAEPGSSVPRRVLKGGSHLCAPEYCLRYRPSARSPQAEDSGTSHVGFRCARDLPVSPLTP